MENNNNVIVVKNLDSRYAIAMGYCIDQSSPTTNIYDSEEEARQNSGEKTPLAGFVILDKETGKWADFSPEWFETCDDAEICYTLHATQLNQKPQENPVVLKLDESYALTVLDVDEDDPDLVCDTFGFAFLCLKTGQITDDGRFETCEEAIKYYEENLRGKEPVIWDFSGKYEFLSNGFDQKANCISFSGRVFRTAEGAFQSCKCSEDTALSKEISQLPYCSAREAKRIGRRVPLRKDWEEIKDIVMYDVLMAKFSQNDQLKQALLDTGDIKIEPHNMKHDNYWGSCMCAECVFKEKKNKLGIVLMRVRANFRA